MLAWRTTGPSAARSLLMKYETRPILWYPPGFSLIVGLGDLGWICLKLSCDPIVTQIEPWIRFQISWQAQLPSVRSEPVWTGVISQDSLHFFFSWSSSSVILTGGFMSVHPEPPHHSSACYTSLSLKNLLLQQQKDAIFRDLFYSVEADHRRFSLQHCLKLFYCCLVSGVSSCSSLILHD